MGCGVSTAAPPPTSDGAPVKQSVTRATSGGKDAAPDWECLRSCGGDGGESVAPSLSIAEPEPESEELERQVFFISDVYGFGVPAGSGNIYVSFTLDGQNEVKTAAMANETEWRMSPSLFGSVTPIDVAGDFKTGMLKVAVGRVNAKRPFASAVVCIDVAELPKAFEELPLHSSSSTRQLLAMMRQVHFNLSFKICMMGMQSALKLKAEADEVVKAEKTKQAEKRAKINEAAKAKAALLQAARDREARNPNRRKGDGTALSSADEADAAMFNPYA